MAANTSPKKAAPQAPRSAGTHSPGGNGHQSTPTGWQAAAPYIAYANGIHQPVKSVDSPNGPHGSGAPPSPAASAMDAASVNDLQPPQSHVCIDPPAKPAVAGAPADTEPQTAIPSREVPEVIALTASVGSPVAAQSAKEAAVAPVAGGQTEAPASKAAASPATSNAVACTGSHGHPDAYDAVEVRSFHTNCQNYLRDSSFASYTVNVAIKGALSAFPSSAGYRLHGHHLDSSEICTASHEALIIANPIVLCADSGGPGAHQGGALTCCQH